MFSVGPQLGAGAVPKPVPGRSVVKVSPDQENAVDLDSLIPILGIIFVIGPVSALVFSHTPLGRAIVNRLGRGGAKASDDRLLELQDEIERLQEQIGYQDTRFDELHDRLDFTERLLTRESPAAEEPERVVTPV